MDRILPSTREWPLARAARTREIEVRALAGRPAHHLMQAAGEAVARLAMAIAPHARTVWIAAGPGNNGGDGLEAAVHLKAAGRSVVVDLQAEPDALPADARRSFERAQAAGVTLRLRGGSTLPATLAPQDIAIDALLGIGASRPPAGSVAEAIRQLNGLRCPVLAVDLPSGLQADTGQPMDAVATVIASHTLSLLTLKPGLFTGVGRDHAGVVWLSDLGVDDSALQAPDAWLSASRPAASVPRRHAQNKGSFGDLIVVGGATGMTGAALMASRAGSAAGAGRVYLHLLQAADAAPLAHDILHPELMFRGDDLLADGRHLAKSTVVCGCGGGKAVAAVAGRLIDGAGRLVLDADALNALAADPALAQRLADRGRRGSPTVLTPHPLEAARLLATGTAEVQADRLGAAARLVDRFGCSVVLKGSGSIVAGPGHTPRINASGNAALASAGTGDVLAGWLGGLWAQAEDAAADGFDAACRAVAQHGAAAEPERAGSMRASDLIEALHQRQR